MKLLKMVPVKSDLPILQDLTGSMLNSSLQPFLCNSQQFSIFDLVKLGQYGWQGMAPSSMECSACEMLLVRE